MLTNLEKGNPLILKGTPFERGLQQAKLCPEMIEPVRQNILTKMSEHSELLQSNTMSHYLEEQTKITEKFFPDVLEEIKGIAKGYNLQLADLISFLHLTIALDMDGCTSWALSLASEGSVIGKNRDQITKNKVFQRVFIHQDPDWQGKKILTVGSLGAPCAYSSGINSDGFCLADTNIQTTDHGLGACRYFLMPFLLATCSSVDQALKKILELPHAGGGSITMADGNEKIAVVELGHQDLNIKKKADWLAITNHFTSTELAPRNLKSGRQLEIENSEDRLRYVSSKMLAIYQDFSQEQVTEMMKSHSQPGGLCVHDESDSSSTVSGSLYTCRDRKLCFSDGSPCDSVWYEFSLLDF